MKERSDELFERYIFDGACIAGVSFRIYFC